MDIKATLSARLIEARENLGLTQNYMANALGIVRQTYAKFERGEILPDAEQLISMTKLLDKPLTFFYEDSDSDVRFALRADAPSLLSPSMKSHLIEKLKDIDSLEHAAQRVGANELPGSVHVADASEASLLLVEQKARSERSRLGIGENTCVGDIVSILESIDIRVIPFQLAPEEKSLLSGFSVFSEKYGAAIFVNNHSSLGVEHQIFSICHEYAHLLFHRKDYVGPGQNYKTRGIKTSPEEKVANHFAACFLVPSNALSLYHSKGDWVYPDSILRLKKIFRVSAACIISRLAQTKLIKANNSGMLWGYANKHGWKTCEPEPLTERLNYNNRLKEIARKAWSREAATESFIADLLDLDRKSMACLLEEWYESEGDK